VIVSWMAWETRDWMARTPLSALRKLKPYVGMITTIPILLFMVMLIQQAWVAGWLGKLLGRLDTKWPYPSIIWLALPLAAWAGVLILRPGLSDAKRVVLFLFGTGLAITLMVDIIAVRGDIGRMNTVFKFYLQVWALFAVCAAAALGWLFMDIKHWLTGWRIPWKVVLYILVCAAGLYTVRAGWDKIQDRWTTHGMATQNSNSLDGMTYMQFVTYPWQGVNMDLSRDYRAIRWVQENIQGSPVIVEAVSGDNYRWYNRFTIYTGLPGVVGWVWHQQQQRELLPDDWVSNRQREVNDFYETFDIEKVKQFLHKYDIRYIVVGQLEQATYPGMCLDKFPQYDGNLWRRVYPAQGVDPANETVIYEVIQP
jgi:uncharacterized membrane protein